MDKIDEQDNIQVRIKYTLDVSTVCDNSVHIKSDKDFLPEMADEEWHFFHWRGCYITHEKPGHSLFINFNFLHYSSNELWNANLSDMCEVIFGMSKNKCRSREQEYQWRHAMKGKTGCRTPSRAKETFLLRLWFSPWLKVSISVKLCYRAEFSFKSLCA